MKKYRLIRKDTLTPEQLAAARAVAPPIELGDCDLDALADWLLPDGSRKARKALKEKLEDDMAAALESAMRGARASFMDIYEYVPTRPDIGGTFQVQRIPGPLLREIQTNFIYVEIPP
ncbi:MAG: hypothetical protein KF841_08485 [Phycisphaerae bacterium]|nr:hypothetical protein [Phycisphaerae bacterium]